MPLPKKDVQYTFDRIAADWYNFRHYTIFKPELERLAAKWGKGRLINLGCGHGADFVPFAGKFEFYGLDLSSEMLKMARTYSNKFGFYADLVQGDLRTLPFSDEAFDNAIAVASYHHLSPEEHISAFIELKRVLKPGGEAFITVWNKQQERFHEGGNEVSVPWHSGSEVLERYYYLLTYEESEEKVKQSGLEIIDSFAESTWTNPDKSESRNICLIVRKR